MEEERRLCYVGITRAKKRLYLLRSYRRSLFGGSTANPPSRFLQDISPHRISPRRLWEDTPTLVATADVVEHPRVSHRLVGTLTLRVGDRVNHNKFGRGIVMNCSHTKGDQELTVVFEGAGVKKLLASLAPLEKFEKDYDSSS